MCYSPDIPLRIRDKKNGLLDICTTIKAWTGRCHARNKAGVLRGAAGHAPKPRACLGLAAAAAIQDAPALRHEPLISRLSSAACFGALPTLWCREEAGEGGGGRDEGNWAGANFWTILNL